VDLAPKKKPKKLIRKLDMQERKTTWHYLGSREQRSYWCKRPTDTYVENDSLQGHELDK